MHACALRVASTKTIYGDERFNERLPPDFLACFAAVDRAAVDELADKCLGSFISTRGHFSFEKDIPHTWLQDIELYDNVFREEVSKIIFAQRRLGTISLDSFALFYNEGALYGFWIETHENEKRRTLASFKSGEGPYPGLPENFEFAASWISNAIADQY
ncbi:hypothetical protein [Rhizobium rhizogenes]|uniref:hypothetical protein n=1 Tax=Rhizobium rhizogenes TaxID=359 RepID=UPI001571C282|nr:hypothetical protein [Rhizobium rhizogenes]NTF80835.1 hypothetical protein [Rhizobium rhizogenes]